MFGAGILVGLAGLSGCAPTPEPIGDRGVVAYYAFGEVSTNLPPPIDLPTSAAAAECALRAKGYVITGRSSLTSDPVKIFAQHGRPGLFEETVVTVESAGGGTRIRVFVRPFGDHDEGRSVLAGTLARLGVMDQRPSADPVFGSASR